MDKDKRFVNFMIAALALIVLNAYLADWFRGPPPKAPVQQVADANKPADPQPAAGAAADPNAPPAPPADPTNPEQPPTEVPGEPPAAVAEAPPDPVQPLKVVALGSLDPKDGYRMLATLTSMGAGVIRAELVNYFNIEDRSGYLGQLDAVDSTEPAGARVTIVGPGTPAARAGLAADDVITAVGAVAVTGARGLQQELGKTRPGQNITLSFARGGAAQQATVTLTRRPQEVLSPEDVATKVSNPPSLLLRLDEVDALRRQAADKDPPGAALRDVNWELVTAEIDHVAFRRALPGRGIEIVKHFRLEKADEAKNQPGYHLTFDVEFRATGGGEHSLVYALEGPNGLPIEGWWFATKVGKPWAASDGISDHFSAIGLRDLVVGLRQGRFLDYNIVRNLDIVDNKLGPAWLAPPPLEFIGVDAQYFASVLLPTREPGAADWLYSSEPFRVGPVPAESRQRNLTNISCRVTSVPVKLTAEGAPITHRYRLFAGPKRPEVLAAYQLDHLVYYGWFEAVSIVLVKVLHFFHDYVVFNYGLAIILLTVVVRLALFPLSRKQAINMQKMQTLQPEIKRLQERYKNQPEQLMRAQRELFAKNNYNPLSGCLPMLIQIPIFLGLYRALAVDVQLRDAPLISHSIPWATNLAAPDALFDWSGWMPSFIQGIMGPYFNVLPLVTIGLFLWQQKMFMPPPTDEQQRIQQTVMKYMMVFMGLLFFKVPSGLCLYFIASSTWGILERKFMPKLTPPAPAAAAGGTGAPAPPALPPTNGNGRSGPSRPKKSKRS